VHSRAFRTQSSPSASGLSVSGAKSRVQRKELKAMLERCCEIALDARGTPVSCEMRPDGILPLGCCAVPAAHRGR
jgi:hypothetical protein